MHVLILNNYILLKAFLKITFGDIKTVVFVELFL